MENFSYIAENVKKMPKSLIEIKNIKQEKKLFLTMKLKKKLIFFLLYLFIFAERSSSCPDAPPYQRLRLFLKLQRRSSTQVTFFITQNIMIFVSFNTPVISNCPHFSLSVTLITFIKKSMYQKLSNLRK